MTEPSDAETPEDRTPSSGEEGDTDGPATREPAQGEAREQEAEPSPSVDSDESTDGPAPDGAEEDAEAAPSAEQDEPAEPSPSPSPVSSPVGAESGVESAADGSPKPTGAEEEDEETKTGAIKAGRFKVPSISLKAFGRTDVGQIREHNEDNLLIADLTDRHRGGTDGALELSLGAGGALLAVCDGMGGAAAGEIASQLAVDIVYEKMLPAAAPRDCDRLAMAMVEALEFAGMRILAESNKNRACRGMGTTATVAALVDDVLLLGQVGDSRGYILRDERLVQVTRDQSLVNQLIEAGQLTEEEAENFEHSNIILQALGTADAVQVDLTYAELRRGDVLLLCSDGLSGMIRDDEIRDIMLRAEEPAEVCQLLVDEANDAGGHDNVTAVIAAFDGEDLRPATTDDTLGLRYQKYPLPSWMNHRHVDPSLGIAFGHGSAYDDTPHIEIHGEIELGPDDDWDDLFDDAPEIPTDSGPNWSTLAIVAAVIGVLVALYFLTH